MNEVKTNNSKEEIVINIKEQVDKQMATLNTKIPDYSELTAEGKRVVDEYMSKIDVYNPQTIDEFGKNETERIYEELDMLIGTIRTNDMSIEEMFTELMMSINEDTKPDSEGFLDTFKKSPLSALKNLKNKPKKTITRERYRREKVLTNIEAIRERLETIRNQLRTNAGKLGIMSQNSLKQYVNIQYQIVALQEMQKRLQNEKQSLPEKRDLFQINQGLQINKAEGNINRKIADCRGISINAATKSIMALLLSQNNEELASQYDRDLASLLPELKGIVVMAEANDSLIQAIDTHNQFVSRVNEMLITESERSKEAIRRIQDTSSKGVIDVETAKVLTSNILETVGLAKQNQEVGRVSNQAFIEVLNNFREDLGKQLASDNVMALSGSKSSENNISVARESNYDVEREF